MANLSTTEKKKLQGIMTDPVSWAQVFLRTFDTKTGKIVPWRARWYQCEMLRDKNKKRVYRCGRRTGKTETMVVDTLFNVCTKTNFRVLIVTPYETQVRLAFMRLNELIQESPLIRDMVVSNTKNPYMIKLKNNSAILGFTTGASSGGGAASVRGQRADLIVMDEVDYMNEADFDSVMIIAGERPDIRTVMSSTPTGKRSKFYMACTNPAMGFNEHFHPSKHNPNWNTEMEAEFRATLSEQGYVHEVEAEFGTQDTGVFNKDRVDEAAEYYNYAYNELDYYQVKNLENNNMQMPDMLLYDINNPAPPNYFRTIGVDYDKYQASSSIVVLEYNLSLRKFMVLKRYEMPRSEYSYDVAVNKIIEFNEIYQPAFIYCDRGSGEYQLERLHIYGEEHPWTQLKERVVGWSFSNKIEITDPTTGETHLEPMKPFMVTQLQIAFERSTMILSKYDEVLYKQLIDYEVVKINQNGTPSFTSENEHFVDALGLAYLAMVLEFKDLTGVMKDREVASVMETTNKKLINHNGLVDSLTRANEISPEIQEFYQNYQTDEDADEQQRWVKTDFSSKIKSNNNYRNTGWGSRDGTSFGSRSGNGWSR